MKCTHPNLITKRYIGSCDTYKFCPDCLETFGGEETLQKKELINLAALAERYDLIFDPE